MKRANSNALLFVLLVVLALAVYILQLTVFQSPRDTAFYFLQDMAFLPLQVAIVSLVLGKILTEREKRDRLKKMNMAISAFFSEAGTAIMIKLVDFAEHHEDFQANLDLGIKWKDADFANALRYYKSGKLSVGCDADSLAPLKSLLLKKRNYMLRMLENPNLLEHDTFTDMLLAVFHVTEELMARDDFGESPTSDIDHLAIDVERALRTILVQWISHMGHLKSDYPYLYSLEVRRNPFHQNNSVMIQ